MNKLFRGWCVYSVSSSVIPLVIPCDNHNRQPSRDEPEWSTVKFKLKQMSVIIHSWVSQVALVVKNPPANAGDIKDTDSIPGLGRSPGEGHGNPCQYSCLGNLIDRGAWWATVQGSQRVRYNWAAEHTYTRSARVAEACCITQDHSGDTMVVKEILLRIYDETSLLSV